MTPPVNPLHAILRALPLHDAISHVKFEIVTRGHDVVKADPGVIAWIEENRFELAIIARMGGLSG